MRVLLDECVPRPLGRELQGHEVRTVAQMGWSGVKNGQLLRLAAGTFDVLVTVDRRMEAEQEIPPDIALLTVETQSNRLRSLRPLVPVILEALKSVKPGQALRVRR